MEIKASEVIGILKKQIENFDDLPEFKEIGQVLSVGDGIAKIYGLDSVEAGEMVEFESGVQGMALNLEQDSVGVVIFGSDTSIIEGQTVKRTGKIVLVRSLHSLDTGSYVCKSFSLPGSKLFVTHQLSSRTVK